MEKLDLTEWSWNALNNVVRTATERECLSLLKAERNGAKRLQYLMRIHSRLNKVRADRERAELTLRCKP